MRESLAIVPFDIIEFAWETAFDNSITQVVNEKIFTTLTLNKKVQDTTNVCSLKNNRFTLPGGKYSGNIYTNIIWTSANLSFVILSLYSVSKNQYICGGSFCIYGELIRNRPNTVNVNFALDSTDTLEIRGYHYTGNTGNTLLFGEINVAVSSAFLINRQGIKLKRIII